MENDIFIYPEIGALHDDMRQWRQHFHQYPETAYEEFATAEFISDKLNAWGLSVSGGWGGTGIVAAASKGNSDAAIALRADMDALFIQEKTQLPYQSRHAGKMHACGHDGHSAMLLGAAHYLHAHGRFDGTVYFIFQPAEEGRAGAQKMLEEGLFEKFPATAVYGLHNFPEIPSGHFAVKPGAMMASFDCFEIRLRGTAAHAAMPHLGQDVIVTAAHLITALQTIVSRHLPPSEQAVVSITQIRGGNTWNALPDQVDIRGTYRCFSGATQQRIQAQLESITQAVADAFSVTAEISYNPDNPGYPVTLNSAAETRHAIAAAQEIVGVAAVDLDPVASLGSEDFAFMLQQKPGCYIWLGNGSGSNSCLLHNPHYDFNDELLPIGASYWAKLVEMQLPLSPRKLEQSI